MAEMEEGRPLLSNEGAARLLSAPEANADGTTKVVAQRMESSASTEAMIRSWSITISRKA